MAATTLPSPGWLRVWHQAEWGKFEWRRGRRLAAVAAGGDGRGDRSWRCQAPWWQGPPAGAPSASTAARSSRARMGRWEELRRRRVSPRGWSGRIPA